MSRRVRPRKTETLAAFVNRVLEQRRTSVNSLARRLAAADGGSYETWQRKLRRWKKGETSAISEENAATLSEALEADFGPFARGGHAVRDLLTRALERIDQLEDRVKALERP